MIAIREKEKTVKSLNIYFCFFFFNKFQMLQEGYIVSAET